MIEASSRRCLLGGIFLNRIVTVPPSGVNCIVIYDKNENENKNIKKSENQI
jgi:hypothetical protein